MALGDGSARAVVLSGTPRVSGTHQLGRYAVLGEQQVLGIAEHGRPPRTGGRLAHPWSATTCSGGALRLLHVMLVSDAGHRPRKETT